MRKNSKEIALFMKMRLTLKVLSCITKDVLAISYTKSRKENTVSNCKVDKQKTISISQMFNHLQ